MESKSIPNIFLFFSLALIACQQETHPLVSTNKILQGREEVRFPYVVPISMDGGYFCTGTFLSDSLLLTAAHCVARTLSVRWESHTSSRLYIHPEWPTEGEACVTKPALAKYDLALVEFPAGTYTLEQARLLERPLQTGETFTIVGYGNNKLIPFERYCTLSPKKMADGLCHVLRGEKKLGASDYIYTSILSFQPRRWSLGPGCPIDCSSTALKSALIENEANLKSFVTNNCDGNFRDRSYGEEGAGIKRSGVNQIDSLSDGTILFAGEIARGQNSISASGDSGGPLLIQESGSWRLAGVTHGGRLKEEDGSLHKVSIYADLTSASSLEWISERVRVRNLD